MRRASALANGAPINQASVAAPSNASDPILANNISTATLGVGLRTDLSATKVASTPSLALWQTTTFTVTFVDAGPSAVAGATLIETLPLSRSVLTFVSSSDAAGTTLTSGVVAGNTANGIATLPVGSTPTLVLQGVAATAGAVIYTTTIAAPAGVTKLNPSNNVGTAAINIGSQADLSLTKSATPTVILCSQTTTFTLVARNPGPNVVTNATIDDTINDTLPRGLFGMTFLSAAVLAAAH